MTERRIPGSELHVIVDADDAHYFVKPITGFLVEWTTARHEAFSTRSFAAAEMMAREVGGRILTTFTGETTSEPYSR